jgi:hypothetical protein
MMIRDGAKEGRNKMEMITHVEKSGRRVGKG